MGHCGAVSVAPKPIASLLMSLVTAEGPTHSEVPGLCFWRASRPVRIGKFSRSVRASSSSRRGERSTFDGGDLVYDENHFLVVTGATKLGGRVLEATPERPYLAICMDLPAEIVARTLLAVARSSEPTKSEDAPARAAKANGSTVPAFVSPLTEPMTNAVVRYLRSLEDPLERKVVAPLVLEELVFRLMRTDAAAVMRAGVRDDDGTIQTAMQYIREHSGRAITVKSIARNVGMSVSNFAHRFSAVARVSPMRFLKRIRLDKARQLMIAERARVQEADARVGYESASHFSRDFKLEYGASPAEYIRRLHDG